MGSKIVEDYMYSLFARYGGCFRVMEAVYKYFVEHGGCFETLEYVCVLWWGIIWGGGGGDSKVDTGALK